MSTASLRELKALHAAGKISRDDLRGLLLVVARDALGDTRSYQRKDGSVATVSAPNYAVTVKALELVAKCEGYVQRAGASADDAAADAGSDADIAAAMAEHLRAAGYDVTPPDAAVAQHDGATVTRLPSSR